MTTLTTERQHTLCPSRTSDNASRQQMDSKNCLCGVSQATKSRHQNIQDIDGESVGNEKASNEDGELVMVP